VPHLRIYTGFAVAVRASPMPRCINTLKIPTSASDVISALFAECLVFEWPKRHWHPPATHLVCPPHPPYNTNKQMRPKITPSFIRYYSPSTSFFNQFNQTPDVQNSYLLLLTSLARSQKKIHHVLNMHSHSLSHLRSLRAFCLWI
jgi:hypothetical protein